MTGHALKEEIVRLSEALGFVAVGFARADQPLERDFERFEAFVDAGLAGELTYLTTAREARRALFTDDILPGAKTIVCFATSYARGAAEEAADPPLFQRIARYARGRDYHNVVRKKLRKVAKLIKQRVPGAGARPLCDVEPVLERAWAARAGVGFVGKNGIVIVPRRGSFVLLGEVVTTVEMPPDEPMTERCGSCRACLDACPTDAFAAPWILDPRKCISYWSIEVPEVAPPAIAAALGDHLFGCDACQTACPYNRREEGACTWSSPLPTARLHDVDDLLALDASGFETAFSGSPMQRATLPGLQRNAVFVAAARLRRDPTDGAAARAIDLAERHPETLVRGALARTREMATSRSADDARERA